LYTTIDGDTWDMIAKKVYDDESKTDFLMFNNTNLLNILVFSSGIVLETPPLPTKRQSLLPEWR